jgi:hypothetical protein
MEIVQALAAEALGCPEALIVGAQPAVEVPLVQYTTGVEPPCVKLHDVTVWVCVKPPQEAVKPTNASVPLIRLSPAAAPPAAYVPPVAKL